MFPIVRAQQRAQGGEEDGEQPRRKRRAESNLHSTDLWHLPGGATGEQCYEIVKEKTLAKRAKVSEAAQRKAARAETRKNARALANELGFNICRNLQSDADMKKLKVPELKAALMYKGVPVDPKLKKIELTALLAHELRGSDCSTYSHSASFVAGPSAEVEPTAADFVDSSDDAYNILLQAGRPKKRFLFGHLFLNTSSPRQDRLFIWTPFLNIPNVFCAKKRVGHACICPRMDYYY